MKVDERVTASSASSNAQMVSSQTVSKETIASSQEANTVKPAEAISKASSPAGTAGPSLDDKRAQRAQRFGIPVVPAPSKMNGTRCHLRGLR